MRQEEIETSVVSFSTVMRPAAETDGGWRMAWTLLRSMYLWRRIQHFWHHLDLGCPFRVHWFTPGFLILSKPRLLGLAFAQQAMHCGIAALPLKIQIFGVFASFAPWEESHALYEAFCHTCWMVYGGFYFNFAHPLLLGNREWHLLLSSLSFLLLSIVIIIITIGCWNTHM